MENYEKPLPDVHDETRPFWDGCKKHELLLQKCLECGRFYFYPRSICPHCFSDHNTWMKVSGRGKVYSFTVSFRPATQAFLEDLPYNIAIVELEEGVRMMSNIVNCDNDDLVIDMPVEVVFDDVTAEFTLPRFKPAL
jgi:uncharacterized OB-fold protein